MAKDERRFVIVPREVLADERFAAVRADRCALGSWLLLYLEADIVWPNAPSLPRWLGDAELELLASAGLLTREGERYRLAIVDAARSAAKAKAKDAADARWRGPDAPSIAPSNAPGIAPSNPTSNAPSNARPHARRDARPMLDPMPTQTQTETETLKRKVNGSESVSVVGESNTARGGRTGESGLRRAVVKRG